MGLGVGGRTERRPWQRRHVPEVTSARHYLSPAQEASGDNKYPEMFWGAAGASTLTSDGWPDLDLSMARGLAGQRPPLPHGL